jgi:hypothetical protein
MGQFVVTKVPLSKNLANVCWSLKLWLFPALADGLKIETSVDEITRLAADFKALQDRFRRAATITALTDVDTAEQTLAELMDRMDVARSSSITPPEWALRRSPTKD